MAKRRHAWRWGNDSRCTRAGCGVYRQRVKVDRVYGRIEKGQKVERDERGYFSWRYSTDRGDSWTWTKPPCGAR